ncbi:MAG: VOC family protein [Alphaproteobacteria bacterium]
MKIARIDHIVLTVRDIDATVAFYTRALGMEARTFAGGRTALHFGRHKINLHPHPSPIEPKAAQPTPGSADLCFVADDPLCRVIEHLEAFGVAIEEGPKTTSGAQGPMTSVYFRDPDGNLIEISAY